MSRRSLFVPARSITNAIRLGFESSFDEQPAKATKAKRKSAARAMGAHYTAEGRRGLLSRRVERARRDGSGDGAADAAAAGHLLPLRPELLGRELAQRLHVLELHALVPP